MDNFFDETILSLFWKRSEEALEYVEKHYGNLCQQIAWNILHNNLDVEECINDSYLILWNNIPPERPHPFRPYLCRIVRNTALKKFRDSHAKKRWQKNTLCFEELSDCIPTQHDLLEALETKELTRAIEQFLNSLDKEKRTMFVKRYWFCMPIKDIAYEYGITERNASVKLSRIRKKLRQFLQQEKWI